ncbi:MAG TPA: hypothetical protein VM846_17785 [Vicinamibacterales bacterium]|nr:hypothetical protein [Vicinamibacterales bacterium]
MIRLLLIVFYVEVGLVLTVAPWSLFWERNYFADIIPLLQIVTTNDFFRGAVTGLGLVNLVAAISELKSLMASRRVPGGVVSIQSSIIEK